MPRNVFSRPSSYRIVEHIITFSSLQVAFTSATSEVLQAISMIRRMPQEYSIMDSKWFTLYYEKSESTAGLESLKWIATTGDFREVSEVAEVIPSSDPSHITAVANCCLSRERQYLPVIIIDVHRTTLGSFFGGPKGTASPACPCLDPRSPPTLPTTQDPTAAPGAISCPHPLGEPTVLPTHAATWAWPKNQG